MPYVQGRAICRTASVFARRDDPLLGSSLFFLRMVGFPSAVLFSDAGWGRKGMEKMTVVGMGSKGGDHQ